MGFYGNFKMQKESYKISVNESYLVEKVSVTSPTSKYGNYQTNKKFKGVTVEIDKPSSKESYSDQQIAEITDKMEKDLKVLSKNFDKTIKKEFEKLLSSCEDWEMDCKTTEDLMKLANLTHVIYTYYPNKNVSLFEIWYNGKAPYNPKFFGGHSFVVELHINNNNLVVQNGQLEG